MRTAFLEDASPEAVSHAVREVLEARGALISEHRPRRVKFHGMPGATKYAFSRAGYVGIYQHLGEPEVMVRLLLRARWTARALVTIAAVNVLVWLTTAIVNPSGTAWFLLAFLTGFALIAAGLVHVGTLRPVREEEGALMEAFEAEFAKGLPSAHIETEDERRARERELELDAEVTRRRLDKARAHEPRQPTRRFTLRPKGPARDEPAQEAEARRAALLARKAELEAAREKEQQQQQQQQ